MIPLETQRRGGFTLVELLVSISIITLLAAMVLVALAGVQENAKVDRTRAQIAKIDALIKERYTSYPDRRVPIPPSTIVAMRNSQNNELPPVVRIARIRRDLLRELMRVELPERKSDVLAPPVVGRQLIGNGYTNALQRAYQRKAAKLITQRTGVTFSLNDPDALSRRLADGNTWKPIYQTAECLYLILSQMTDGDKPALSFFSDQEIGDFDGDGIPEVLDAWGNPIRFLRWAPGYEVAGGPQEIPELPEESIPPDPIDPYQLDGPTFPLYPLVISAGPDGLFDIGFHVAGSEFAYASTTPPNNPYHGWNPTEPATSNMFGMRADVPSNNRDDSLDNISNHTLIANE